jgi:hypothetical protein
MAMCDAICVAFLPLVRGGEFKSPKLEILLRRTVTASEAKMAQVLQQQPQTLHSQQQFEKEKENVFTGDSFFAPIYDIVEGLKYSCQRNYVAIDEHLSDALFFGSSIDLESLPCTSSGFSNFSSEDDNSVSDWYASSVPNIENLLLMHLEDKWEYQLFQSEAKAKKTIAAAIAATRRHHHVTGSAWPLLAETSISLSNTSNENLCDSPSTNRGAEHYLRRLLTDRSRVLLTLFAPESLHHRHQQQQQQQRTDSFRILQLLTLRLPIDSRYLKR